MTNRQLAESLVNRARGGYRPEEVVSLIIHGIERYVDEQISQQELSLDKIKRERQKDRQFGT